jgi:hypothetical protein
MNALSVYQNLKERGVILQAQGERLKVDAPVGVVTEEDKRVLLKFKPDLLGFLSRTPEGEPLHTTEARWSRPGFIRILDPFTGEWHEWPTAECLPGIVAEADRLRNKARAEGPKDE